MWTIAEMKEKGKAAFKANYWLCVLMSLLMGLFTGGTAASRASELQESDLGSTMSSLTPEQQLQVILVVLGVSAVAIAVAVVIKVFLANPVILGGNCFFKRNLEETPAPFDTIKIGFQNYWHNFVTLFLRDLYLLLWFLLLIVPGFIKAYSYRMVPYILAENPDMPANEVITRSREMMDGNKWQAFLLDLSFIGWMLLGVLTLGLGLVFWTAPYMYSTQAALYLRLKEAQSAA